MLTPEQKLLRRNGIGGSDAAPVCGISRFKTPLAVYLEKIGLDEEDVDNVHTRVGSKLEPILLELFVEQKGFEDIKVEPGLETLKHPEHDFILGNIDARILDEKWNAIIECKTASLHAMKDWGAEMSDEIPSEYLCQTAHYAEVTGADLVYIPVSFLTIDQKNLIDTIDDVSIIKKIAATNFKIYLYRKNEKLQKQILAMECHFWKEYVLEKMPPMGQTNAELSFLYKGKHKEEKQATPEVLEEVGKLKEIVKQKEELVAQETEIKTKLCQFLGEAESLVAPTGEPCITWKSRVTPRMETESFKKDHPSLYAQYCRTNETRVFKIL